MRTWGTSLLRKYRSTRTVISWKFPVTLQGQLLRLKENQTYTHETSHKPTPAVTKESCTSLSLPTQCVRRRQRLTVGVWWKIVGMFLYCANPEFMMCMGVFLLARDGRNDQKQSFCMTSARMSFENYCCGVLMPLPRRC